MLTISSLGLIPIITGIMVINKYYFRPKLAIFRKTNAKITSTMTENIMGARVSRSFAREDYNQEEFETVNKQYTKDLIDAYKASAFINPFYEYSGTVMSVIILVVGGIMIINQIGGLTAGILVLYILYISQFAVPLMELVTVYGEIQSSFAAFERICSLLDQKVSIKEKIGAVPLIISEGRIEFINVKFAYTEKSPVILDDFNLVIEPGETLAIVGHTGAGKTTTIRLVARLYDVKSGKVTIDGMDVRDATLSTVRGSTGYVLQEPFLFSESIRYNLCYGKKVPDEELRSILSLVGADFVFDLSNGLDTVVGERGSRLSLGQRQLLAFARVLVTDPKVLLLDEATSSIDPQAELCIQRAMEKLQEDRTSVIIAHRLSTIKGADRIIMLDNGKIVEEGTFDELIRGRKAFYELYRMQFHDVEESGVSV